MSVLPGKALRMLVESRGLLSDSACVLDAEPGKLDITRREPGILFISLHSSHYRIWLYYRVLCQIHVIESATSWWDRQHLSGQRATMQLIWEVTDKGKLNILKMLCFKCIQEQPWNGLEPFCERTINAYHRHSCFENSADPDQLASKKKPTDQEPHCFPLYPCIYLGRTSGLQGAVYDVRQRFNILLVK